MIMKTPAPFGSVGPNKIDNSPLTGSNYPCKVTSDPASFYSKDGLDNTMAIGEPQTLSFIGSAVHGGGSCQLALTKDPQPSASTSWQVILSIEGGCPSKNGQGADEYQFTIPDGVAPGDYVFAWTWVSKLSGQPEYYMNCAPITVTGGSGKRDLSHNETMDLFPRDTQFPELAVFNLATINDCKSTLSTDPTYANPGSNVMKPGSSNNFAPITGTNCVPKGAKDSGSGSSSGSGSGSASSSATAASPTSAASSQPSGFMTSTVVATSSSEAAPTSSAVASSSSSPAVPSTSSAPSLTSSSPASGPSGSPSSGSGVQGLVGPCTAEGMFNCIGGTNYQQCASGSWSVVMAMPPTTKCAEGQTMTLWGRDESADNKGNFQMRRRGY
ncbi:hypothetical protein F5Y19DRAFT_363899 [Xylariaceae sp. FL1651]|nr:hypothetical protein F5Y19DRAFT_363899 [Xylariaceae sp. FL1651]